MKRAPLRDMLEGAGVSERDLTDAVRQARKVTQAVDFWGTRAAGLLAEIANHPKLGKRVKPYVVLLATGTARVTQGARSMLNKK